MKKKVLTTAAALAMLAPTMTSFASTLDKTTVQGTATQPQSSELKIQGSVNNSSGQAPAGQISVTLPTSVSFIVDETGDVLVGKTMAIENKSSDVDVSVSVSSFSDTTPTKGKGITLVQEQALQNADRSFVNLKLVATGGTSAEQVTLLSENFQEQKLVDLSAGTSTGLTLAGQSGTGGSGATDKYTGDLDGEGATDSFTLVFKIAKQ